MKFKSEKKYIFEVLGLDATRADNIHSDLMEYMKGKCEKLNVGDILNEIWNKKTIVSKTNERLFATLLLGVEIGKLEVVKMVFSQQNEDTPMMYS